MEPSFFNQITKPTAAPTIIQAGPAMNIANIGPWFASGINTRTTPRLIEKDMAPVIKEAATIQPTIPRVFPSVARQHHHVTKAPRGSEIIRLIVSVEELKIDIRVRQREQSEAYGGRKERMRLA